MEGERSSPIETIRVKFRACIPIYTIEESDKWRAVSLLIPRNWILRLCLSGKYIASFFFFFYLEYGDREVVYKRDRYEQQIYFLIIQNSSSCCMKNVFARNIVKDFFFSYSSSFLLQNSKKYWLDNLIFIKRMFLNY